MQLAEGQFIDPATAAKLGKGLAATAVLTGSYLVLGENIRIDARMVKVETGEVMMAEQVAGTQDDFFTLQKVLAEKNKGLNKQGEATYQADAKEFSVGGEHARPLWSEQGAGCGVPCWRAGCLPS
jgi:hypothetical protein